jgi:TonB-linked SusC/RagA family outer membrane protein
MYSQIKISGNVTDTEDGYTLPGVSVVIKGTETGTTTDFDGNYQITVSKGDILSFTFIGMKTEEVIIKNQTEVNIAMMPDVTALNDVVVTALGLSREKKSLGYSVAEVKGDELTKVAQENVMNSLAGKMAGVQINSTGGSAGSSVNVIIRGATSLSSDNQPLYVVDGVPINNQLGNVSTTGDRNSVDYGSPISDINSDDIESVSVLKGASAAALYGSRAGNGVILITTKSGKRNQDIKVSISSSIVVETPYKFLEQNNSFATGYRPEDGEEMRIPETLKMHLGAPLDSGNKGFVWNSPLDSDGKPIAVDLISHPDNVKNFVQTGITTNNNISVTGGHEKGSFRVSLSNMTNKGIIPNSDLYRTSFGVNGTYDLSKKLTLSTNVNITQSRSNDVAAGSRGANPMQWAYYTSSHIDILDLQNQWKEGEEQVQQNTVPDHNNPYFIAYEITNSFNRNRIYGNTKLEWEITPEISFMGRYSLDQYNELRETKIPYSYRKELNGAYGIHSIQKREQNFDFLGTYNKRFEKLSLNVSVGGNVMYRNNSYLSTSTKNGGEGLIVPGFYNVTNILPSSLNYSNYSDKKAIYSLYSMASLGYNDMIYLDLTARNDWSSTLPTDNRSYFYPSASLSALVSEMFTMSNEISLIKLRVGIAQVGNDTNPYSLQSVLYNAGTWDDVPRMTTSDKLLLSGLEPEIATSMEVGTDMAFFDNRLRFDITYYETDNKNQILSVGIPISSGYGNKLINAGLVQSKGLEVTLGGTPIQSNDWRWDINFSFTRNRTKITELSDGIEYFKLWQDVKGGAFTYVGGEIGDIYDQQMITVEDENSEYYGWPLLDKQGEYQIKGSDIEDLEIIGNFNPDFTLGLQTSLTYKKLTLSASLDWRQGGQFISQTMRDMDSKFMSQNSLENLINPNGKGDISNFLKSNPDKYIKGIHTVGGPTAETGGYELNLYGWIANDGVFIPGVVAEYDADGNIIGYKENLGRDGTKFLPMAASYPWDFTRASMYDASFVKLREISLSYMFDNDFIKKIGLESASASIYSRNIILWTEANIGIDPETAFQPVENGGFEQGIEHV